MSHAKARGRAFGIILFSLLVPSCVIALGSMRYVSERASAGSFPIVQDQRPAVIWMDGSDYAGVLCAATNLQADIARVTGCMPELTTEQRHPEGDAIVVGTAGKSRL